MHPNYSVYDDLGFTVSNGQVILTGDVVRPIEKTISAGWWRSFPASPV
jgi:hypothetical protein